MGRVARWIDSLDDASRDRVIEHPDPTYDGGWWWDDGRECGCLVGCALWSSGEAFDEFCESVNLWFFVGHAIGMKWGEETQHVGGRFPALTSRFGAERMWRVVKARAAKANRVVIPAVAEEAALA